MICKKKRLEQAHSVLEGLDDALCRSQIVRHHIETKNGPDGTLEIYANAEGLVHLAYEILNLARGGFEGKHHHFDNAGMLDNCERPFVVSYKSAEWDEK